MKKEYISNSEMVSAVSHLLIDEKAPNRLIGRLFTLIEVAGLPKEQEKSIKDLVKQYVFQTLSYEGEGLYIDQELSGVLRHLSHDQTKGELKELVPNSKTWFYKLVAEKR